MYIVHVDGKLSFFKNQYVKNWKIVVSNYVTLASPYGKTTVLMKLLKVSIGVKRYQVSLETVFELICVEIFAVEAQKVFRADSTPLHFIDRPESPP